MIPAHDVRIVSVFKFMRIRQDHFRLAQLAKRYDHDDGFRLKTDPKLPLARRGRLFFIRTITGMR